MTLIEFVDAIVGDLECSCSTIEEMMEKYDVDFGVEVNEVEEELGARHNLERCAGCDWWMDASELAHDYDGWCGYCEDCRPAST